MFLKGIVTVILFVGALVAADPNATDLLASAPFRYPTTKAKIPVNPQLFAGDPPKIFIPEARAKRSSPVQQAFVALPGAALGVRCVDARKRRARLRVLRWKRFAQGDEDAWAANTRRFTEKTGVEVRVDQEGWEDSTAQSGGRGQRRQWSRHRHFHVQKTRTSIQKN